MGYVPRAVTQVDPSDPCWKVSCWAAVGCWLVRGASRGRRKPDMEWFRDRAGVDYCRPGGRNDVRNGLQNIFYRKRSMWDWGDGRVHNDLGWGELHTRLTKDSGRLFWLATDFDVWTDQASVCQPGFNDPADGDSYHAIGVVAGMGTGKNKGKVRVLNPLCSTLKWVPINVVLNAALQYAKEHPGRIDALSILPPERDEIS